jgi:uncharacterized protein (UPF0333 family)
LIYLTFIYNGTPFFFSLVNGSRFVSSVYFLFLKLSLIVVVVVAVVVAANYETKPIRIALQTKEPNERKVTTTRNSARTIHYNYMTKISKNT